MGNVGAKIREGFDWVGKKMNEGWESVKSFGKKAWDTVKGVPVIGKIAEGIEKYTPIGWAATNAIRGIDTAVGGTSKLLQGDVKGAVGRVTSGIREGLNQENPLLQEIKKVPVLGDIARAGQSVVERIPIAGGFSISDIKNIGNASLNAVDAFKEGDVAGGFKNAAQAGLGLASKGAFGQNVANAAKVVTAAKAVV